MSGRKSKVIVFALLVLGLGIAAAVYFTRTPEPWSIRVIAINAPKRPAELEPAVSKPPITRAKPVSPSEIGEEPSVNTGPSRQERLEAAVRSLGEMEEPPAHVMAMTLDARNRVWMATEGGGLWRYDPNPKAKAPWTRFNEFGDDNFYALACDQAGRVWCGSQYRGLSVFDGSNWRDFNRLTGALGERVYAIAVCPTDGSVWIATNCGLTRYSDTDGWRQITRMDGLPSLEIGSLCFDVNGNLFAGTLCDGLAIALASDKYSKWRVVRGPIEEPIDPSGEGLPSNLINCVLVASDGTLYVGTTVGLAISSDKGETFKYIRGDDSNAKIKARIDGPPAGFKERPTRLSEDWITCLAEDGAGMLWIGHRKGPHEVYDPKKKSVVHSGHLDEPKGAPLDDIRAILPLQGLSPLIGGRHGVLLSTRTFDTSRPARLAGAADAKFPSSQRAPLRGDLEELLKTLEAVPNVDDWRQPLAVKLEDDWTTRGAWLGRRGTNWAMLCGKFDHHFYTWGAGSEKGVVWSWRLGKGNGSGNYYWTDELNFTENPKALEMPPVFFDTHLKAGRATLDKDRRQTEWNDGGWRLPMTMDGPNLRVDLNIPPGSYILSIYHHNKDGKKTKNRFRDFPTYLREAGARPPVNFPIAQGRVVDYFGGAYQCFLVRGPANYSVEIERNYSNCVDVNAFMLDTTDATVPYPYAHSEAEWKALVEERALRRKTSPATKPPPPATDVEVVERIHSELERIRLTNVTLWATERRRFYAPLARWHLRTLTQNEPRASTKADLAKLGECYYHLGLYKEWEDCRQFSGQTTPRMIEKALKSQSTDEMIGRGRDAVIAHLKASNGAPTDALDLNAAFADVENESAKLRIRALERIGISDDARAARTLIAMLKDKDLSVRIAARQALSMRVLAVPSPERMEIRDALETCDRELLLRREKLIAPKEDAIKKDDF